MTDAFIIGYGFVGKATAKSLSIEKYFDLQGSNITLEEGSKMNWCFICLPTPTNEHGNQAEGRKIIHDYIGQLKDLGFKGVFVIRSTVIPGTCKALAEEWGVRVASCPETLSEDTWEEDAIHPRIIFAGADDLETRNALMLLWNHVPSKIRIFTDTVTAETMKYAFNSFFLTKVIWANQMYDVCQKNGANYKVIREALHEHPWGSKHHLKAIHKGGRGGGGHCFPKDIKALAKYSNLKLFKVVDELNDKYLSESSKK
jgi:nucleotide sugar dehydrogenase